MEITQIRYFVAVAQSENMSRAAAELGISQPSLSKSVSKLESELGCQLFNRNGRHIKLNAEGKRFLAGSIALLRQLDDAVFDVREFAQNHVERLSVGIAGTNSKALSLLADFARQCPEVRFRLQCGIEAKSNIDINQYDMLIYPAGAQFNKFEGFEFYRDPYLLAVGKGHPLMERLSAAKEEDPCFAVSLEDIKAEDFAFIQYGKDHFEPAYALCVKQGFRPRVRVFTNELDMHRQAIAQGLAIGFVADGSAGSYRNDPNIALFPLANDSFGVDLMVCFKRQKHLSELGLALRDFVLSHIN